MGPSAVVWVGREEETLRKLSVQISSATGTPEVSEENNTNFLTKPLEHELLVTNGTPFAKICKFHPGKSVQ